jgi:hypothetical protein
MRAAGALWKGKTDEPKVDHAGWIETEGEALRLCHAFVSRA